MKCHNNQSILIGNRNNLCKFDIKRTWVESRVERMIWIGFYKNNINRVLANAGF